MGVTHCHRVFCLPCLCRSKAGLPANHPAVVEGILHHVSLDEKAEGGSGPGAIHVGRACEARSGRVGAIAGTDSRRRDAAKGQAEAFAGADEAAHRLDAGDARRGGARQRGRSRPRGAEAAVEHGIQLHDPRFDGRGVARSPQRVPRRWRRRRRIHEHRRGARHVARAAHEVSRRCQGHRRARRFHPARASLVAEHFGAGLDG